jgi:hypothetical protein
MGVFVIVTFTHNLNIDLESDIKEQETNKLVFMERHGRSFSMYSLAAL